jgi:hypothetical protein
MRSRLLVALTVIASAPLLHGCASRSAEAADPRARRVPPQPESIPLITDQSLPGCRFRVVGDLIAADLHQLRGMAYQKQADAVMRVRQETVATRRPTRQVDAVRPAAHTVFTGVAIRLDSPDCLYTGSSKAATGG